MTVVKNPDYLMSLIEAWTAVEEFARELRQKYSAELRNIIHKEALSTHES